MSQPGDMKRRPDWIMQSHEVDTLEEEMKHTEVQDIRLGLQF